MTLKIEIELQFKLDQEIDPEEAFEALVNELSRFDDEAILDLDAGVDLSRKVIHINGEVFGANFEAAETYARDSIGHLMMCAVRNPNDFELISIAAQAGQEKLIDSL